MPRILGAILLLLVSPWATLYAQDQPPVNCVTIEQCRVLVMVVRGQLLSAQDAWAFWAQHADALQKQLDKLQKDVPKKEEEKGE